VRWLETNGKKLFAEPLDQAIGTEEADPAGVQASVGGEKSIGYAAAYVPESSHDQGTQ
jgi:hypothetical protein